MDARTGLLATTLATMLVAGCGRGEDTGTGKAAAPAEPAPAAAAESVEPASMPRSASPPDARLYFVTPADGDTVSSPVHVEFGLDGMQVVTAGTAAPDSGHHHILIDTGLPPLDAPIPADENHVHFGDGSTSTDLELAPGEHTLQLLLGDYLHVPHSPPVYSERIRITVE